eukprot:CAMPEP_0177734204 /NCGR_PEP_ID=MMETSP0484_2-20121128/24103_1 /TAXON_ID=354590 /ORGANISM="Rhodomonas lens, Strain RHODO" /LENGTH=169 /DNA_ID=CAMNT_0019247655 /DNA_START=136 /DNA_END=646 /DNA_ORIENTATION=+
MRQVLMQRVIKNAVAACRRQRHSARQNATKKPALARIGWTSSVAMDGQPGACFICSTCPRSDGVLNRPVPVNRTLLFPRIQEDPPWVAQEMPSSEPSSLKRTGSKSSESVSARVRIHQPSNVIASPLRMVMEDADVEAFGGEPRIHFGGVQIPRYLGEMQAGHFAAAQQ